MVSKQSDQVTRPESIKGQSRRSIPLRLILITPFILQIFTAVGLTGYLSIRNGQKSVNDVASQLRQEVATRVKDYLTNFTNKPTEINQMNAQAINLGIVDARNQQQLIQYFWHQSRNLGKNVPLFIYFGNTEGGFAGAGGTIADDPPSIDYTFNFKAGDIYGYIANENGYASSQPFSQEGAIYDRNYDARKRPWYIDAVTAQGNIWTEVYSYADGDLGITTSQPVYDRNRNLLGVIAVDFALKGISESLRQVKVGKNGTVFIIERDGSVIGSSTPEPPYVKSPDKGEPQRLKAIDSSIPLISQSTLTLQKQVKDFSTVRDGQQLEFMIDGERQFASIIPFQNQQGLNWLIVVVVPESDFMEQINANTRTTIFLCILALVMAVISGIYTSRWILSPINRLNNASQGIARGNLDQQIQPENIQELDRLGQTFNEMSQQLQASFHSLEKRVEERTTELQVAKEDAEFAKQAADNANQAKSEFLANMSHELRTPLNGILGYAQILGRMKVLPEKVTHGVNIIHQCGSHLLTLINDVLDISKIEARKLELMPNVVRLPSLIQGVVEISQIRSQQKSLNFVYEPDPDLPLGVIVDEKRLRQVLINLLGNAIKFTDQGSVTLKVELLASTTIGFNTAHLRFTVIDTGVGIAPEDIQKLFRAFEQVGDRQRQAEGTGLGLAISQQIVQLMGGEIRVASQIGVGSEFSFEVELPLNTAWALQQNDGKGNIISYEGDRKRILVVDDRWENRSIIMNLLEPLGFTIIEAENGQEGLAKMRETLPDLVITDLVMPVMSGFEMLQELRHDENLRYLKVLVSSASVSQTDQQMSLDGGGDDFLSKPVNAQELFDALATHLQLVWHYEEAVTPIEDPSGAMILPESGDLQILLELAQEGRLKKLAEIAQEISQRDDRYQPFIQQILQLAKKFQSEKIEKLIQQHLSPN